MKLTTTLAFAAIALASQASAQVLYYTQPTSASTWQAGETATVSWNNDCEEVTGNTTFPITLNVQSPSGLQTQVGADPIGYLDCSDSGTTEVQVPLVPQGSGYSILVKNGGSLSYSALFTINSNITGSATITTAGPSTTATLTVPSTTAIVTSTSSLPNITVSTTTTGTATPTKANDATILKAGSTAALVIVAAVASLML
ncbi:hypothetical protein BC939DRAFT_249933 [Gamsiella multidivaricata]|uniref:uncharacterized protein n=1 Tax=Gamsiella multidivaricata TaxID=101098 RepID=UPI00221F39E3|nr:uncharacterized protein BC939DRAFT_249933 [Gamsiella multidivaricata]KAI7819665.1 hypothetical protein BC939DRAFT_249933 [Gamsiella multidivaricata]